MSNTGKAKGGGGIDWREAIAAAESEPLSFEGRVCPLGKPDASVDPEAGLAAWKKQRGDRKAEQQVYDRLLSRSVHDALLNASKQQVRGVISEVRRGRSRGRMKDRGNAMVAAAASGSDYTMASFWQAQNRRDDDDFARRNASSSDEPRDLDPKK